MRNYVTTRTPLFSDKYKHLSNTFVILVYHWFSHKPQSIKSVLQQTKL